jgi:hypothetical protein
MADTVEELRQTLAGGVRPWVEFNGQRLEVLAVLPDLVTYRGDDGDVQQCPTWTVAALLAEGRMAVVQKGGHR